MYHAIFESHLPYYASLVWVWYSSSVKRLHYTDINSHIFQNRNTHTSPLFKNWNILELSVKLVHENCIIVSKSLHKTLPKILCDWFILSFESHSYSISWARYSVNTNVIYIWDFLHSQHQGTLFYLLRTKGLITCSSLYLLF